MKLKLILFPLCLIAIHAFGFEGTIKQTIKNYNGSGSDVTMTWYLGANNCRIDMAVTGKDVNSNTVFILDPASSTIKTYEANSSAAQKSYFQINAATISGGVSIASLTASSDVKQINGYKCEKWTVVTSVGVYNIWVAKDIDIDWVPYKNLLKTSVEVQTLASQGIKGFPMMTEAISGNNSAIVESVSKQPLASNTFTVPSEYTLYAPKAQATKTK